MESFHETQNDGPEGVYSEAASNSYACKHTMFSPF